MKRSRITLTFVIAAALLLLAAQPRSLAGSATWDLNPTSSDWNTAGNWTPATVPNGPTDVATFALSNTTGVTLSAASTKVAEIVFAPGADGFNIAVGAAEGLDTLIVSGTGVVNNSSVAQNVTIGSANTVPTGLLEFENNATAGTNTVYTVWGSLNGEMGGNVGLFAQNSTAGSATFIANGASEALDEEGGGFSFLDDSTAGNANFTINGAQGTGSFGGSVSFINRSTAGNGTFVLNPGSGVNPNGGSLVFIDYSSAGNGVFTLNGSTVSPQRTEIFFGNVSTAADGYFTVMGGQGPDSTGGEIQFMGLGGFGGRTSAGNATIVNEGGTGIGSTGGLTEFTTQSTAGQAVIIANGSDNSGGPGLIYFDSNADGGQAQVELNGAGSLDISATMVKAGVTIGSLAGDGSVLLGPNTLTIGSNSQNTIFSGVIEDGSNGSGGSLSKVGAGTLTLSGVNTYTGGTIVDEGTLLVKTKRDSATGTGPVQVNAGIFGGRSNIAGAVTIGSGNGPGATLAPGIKGPGVLAIYNTLAFQADGSYNWEVNLAKSKGDKVICKGATIAGGAQFTLEARGNQALPAGTVFTVIENKTRQPISGTFANLPDGAVISAGGNSLQASYEGGDGNDLTLTVLL